MVIKNINKLVRGEYRMKIYVKPDNVIDYAVSELKDNILKIKYSNNINESTWDNVANGDFEKIKDSIPKKDNIYVIMIKVKTKTKIFDEDTNYYEVKYIGKSYNIRKRLRNHLVCKSKKTSSCLQHVKDYVLRSSTKEVYISTIEVIPRELNSYVESLLLKQFNSKNVWYTRKS